MKCARKIFVGDSLIRSQDLLQHLELLHSVFCAISIGNPDLVVAKGGHSASTTTSILYHISPALKTYIRIQSRSLHQEIQILTMHRIANVVYWLILLLLLRVAIAKEDADEGVYSSKVIKKQEGLLQYHRSDVTPGASSTCCDSVVIINVGTEMSVTDYQDLGKKIVNNDTVSIIIDDNPKKIKKQDGKKFAALVNAIAHDLVDIVGDCCMKQPKNGYLLGGHSGGGEAAVLALQHESLDLAVTGFLGLAPFTVTPATMEINVPSLIWDFSKETCSVSPEFAGIAAYSICQSKERVFYQVQTDNTDTKVHGPHCSFTDKGCGSPLQLCTGGKDMQAWIHDMVPYSIHKFVNAVVTGSKFTEDRFHIDDGPNPVHIYVSNDMAKQSTERIESKREL